MINRSLNFGNGNSMEQVNTVDDYFKKLSRYDIYSNVFYRGQLEKHTSITSSISRDERYTINESAIFNEAVDMKSTEFKDLPTPIERLSKMQHYGIPTRLVDLSVNPLIALFFAVQNIDDNSHGNVYVFIQPEHNLNDKRIKLLSLLATLDLLDIKTIKNSFFECYLDNITEEEIIKFASEGAFLKYSMELQRSNERLYCQEGTFAICGNRIIDAKLQKYVLPLDSIEPTMKLRIPYEYKKAIKKELDEKYYINETTIYPEFTSVADYLKEKYRKTNFDLHDTHSILQVQDVSHAGARRCSIVTVLNKSLRIEKIKKIGIQIIKNYKDKNDVVWVYIAKNGDDYIMKNWMIRVQWIRESLVDKFKPSLIGEVDELGYIWRFEKSYSTLADHADEYAFVDDKILYTQNMKTFDEFKPHYEYVLNAFENEEMKDIEDYTLENSSEITKFFSKFGDYGHSRNEDFNKYLNNFQEIALQLGNVVLWLKKEELNIRSKRYQISKCLKDAKLNLDTIEEQSLVWKKTINLTDEEYNEIDIGKIERKEYHYKQTIPINVAGLEVTFDLTIFQNNDNTVSIKGETNLFDNATLMIFLRNCNGLAIAQNKSLVDKGQFNFGRLGKKGIGLDRGKYKVNITLPIPSVQNKEFVKKAGIEYENLIGEFVDRSGLGPTVCYTEEFEINY